VQPRTVLLRQGLDEHPAQTYLVAQEEVSRAGTRVLQAYQRTRWTDGRVVAWLRVRRQTGRGEGSSGLRFDFLVNQGQPAP
jgi:protein-disulfide isomerase-like protein with CxxC motif